MSAAKKHWQINSIYLPEPDYWALADAKRARRTARFFHADSLSINSELELDKTTSHHLLTVLRARSGDTIIVFNGDGFDYHATLLNDNQRGANRQARLSIGERIFRETESPLSIRLLQCVSRADRMEITIRQAVESGVSDIRPVLSRHSANLGDEKRATKKQLHWRSIVTSAVEQSGRAVLPTLSDIQTLSHCVQALDSTREHGQNQESDCRLVLSPTATLSISETVAQVKRSSGPPNTVTLIVGPESGLDADEIALAEDNGFHAVHIGPRILRTETAGPACIVLLQTLLGDLQVP